MLFKDRSRKIKTLTLVQLTLVIVSITFAIRASNNMISTTLPLIAKYQLNFSGSEIGILASLFTVSGFVMSYRINTRLRPVKRRKLFIISSIGYMIILPAFYFYNMYTIWVLSILGGFVLGAIMPNIITSASLVEGRKNRERLLAIYTLTLSLSLIMGPLIEAAILLHYSFRTLFLFFSATGVVIAVTSFFVPFPGEEHEEIGGNIWKNSGFKISILNIMIYNIPFGVLTTFGGIFAIDNFKISYSMVIALFSLFFFSSLLGRLYYTMKPPKDLLLNMLSSAILTMAGLSMLVISWNYLSLAFAFLLLGVPHGLTYPLSLFSINRYVEQSSKNVANSTYFSLMMGLGVITPLMAGFIVSIIPMRYTFALFIPWALLLMLLLKMEFRHAVPLS